jgi:hypothetical protein
VLVVRDAEKQPCEERIIDLQRLSGQEGGAVWLIRDVMPNGTHGIRIEEYVRSGLQII